MSENDHHKKRYVVNGKDVAVDDRDPTARDLLIAGGYKPPSEHQLLSLEGARLRYCPHEDVLPEDERRFRAFEGGELFRFTLDEIDQVWGAESAEVGELLQIFEVRDNQELVLERKGQPDLVLTREGEVLFGPKGVEHLVTRRCRHDGVLVSVLTTNGVFPAEGAIRVEPETLVSNVLARTAERLDLGDTSRWVVTSTDPNRAVDPTRSFSANGLVGAVTLAWNAPEGGGGNA